MPLDITTLLPSLKIVSSTAASSYELKDEGVRAALADIVGVIDADCIPAPDWLQHLMNVMRKHADVVAVSGRTEYPGNRLVDRLLALLSRAYLIRAARLLPDSYRITTWASGARRFLPALFQLTPEPRSS
jgi:GT2 family glycosyltransferase